MLGKIVWSKINTHVWPSSWVAYDMDLDVAKQKKNVKVSLNK